MDNKVELLVKEYKKTKNKLLFDNIFRELIPLVRKKVKFVFERKRYPFSLYHQCKHCRVCDVEDRVICENCLKCECEKGTFNLRQANLCDYEDVENDLWLEIIRIIEHYDVTRNFNTYLYACVFDYRPSFLTKDFIKSIKHRSLTHVNEEGEEVERDIPDVRETNTVNHTLSMSEIFSVCKTDREREVLAKLLKNNEMSQEEIASEIGIGQQAVGKIISKLRTRLKNKSSEIN